MGIAPDFKQLLDGLKTAIMVVDENFRLVYLNSACESLMEISLGFAYGISASGFFHESVDDLINIRSCLKSDTRFTKRKAQWRLHNKKTITVDYTVTPFASYEQIMLEIQPLDRILQISREEAMIASQSTTRNLIRGLAHEVKNPLGGIRGAAQLLEHELDQVSKNPELKDYTNVIISESDRLRNLVDRMLGPRQPVDFSDVNIHEVLERVITLIKAETKGQIRLIRNYDPSIPDVQGDIELMIQALLNVVRNAKQALMSQEDNTNPTISLTTRIIRKFTIGRKHFPLVCCCSVTDNGPGIPPDIFEDIFYPMISGRAEGMGLGLSISQQLINQHGGLIECTSEPGDTCFSIYIPLG